MGCSLLCALMGLDKIILPLWYQRTYLDHGEEFFKGLAKY